MFNDMKNRNEILRDMIAEAPEEMKAKSFTVPISWDIDEDGFDGYEFSYSKYLDIETAYLSTELFRDEDLFYQESRKPTWIEKVIHKIYNYLKL